MTWYTGASDANECFCRTGYQFDPNEGCTPCPEFTVCTEPVPGEGGVPEGHPVAIPCPQGYWAPEASGDFSACVCDSGWGVTQASDKVDGFEAKPAFTPVYELSGQWALTVSLGEIDANDIDPALMPDCTWDGTETPDVNFKETSREANATSVRYFMNPKVPTTMIRCAALTLPETAAARGYVSLGAEVHYPLTKTTVFEEMQIWTFDVLNEHLGKRVLLEPFSFQKTTYRTKGGTLEDNEDTVDVDESKAENDPVPQQFATKRTEHASVPKVLDWVHERGSHSS